MASNEQNGAGFVLTDAADPKLAEIYSQKAFRPLHFFHILESRAKYINKTFSSQSTLRTLENGFDISLSLHISNPAVFSLWCHNFSSSSV